MNTPLLIVVVCWVAIPGFSGGAGEQEETASTKTEISDQQIVRLPTSVHHSTGEDGTHVVTIDGIGAAPPRDRERQDPPTEVLDVTPLDSIPSLRERVSFNVDHDKRTCTLVTSRELKLSELSAAIDETAKARSDIPCWAELEARDLERAAEFRDGRYVPEKVEGEAPSGLAWFCTLGLQGFSAPFVVKFGDPLGRLLIVPTVVPLGSLRHYTIRILDHDGQILWTDTSTAFGYPRIAVGDSDGDDRHEIYVESCDYEGKKLFHIKPPSERCPAQPAAQPADKPPVKNQPSPPTSMGAPR